MKPGDLVMWVPQSPYVNHGGYSIDLRWYAEPDADLQARATYPTRMLAQSPVLVVACCVRGSTTSKLPARDDLLCLTGEGKLGWLFAELAERVP